MLALLLLALAQYVAPGPLHDSGQSVSPAFEGWFRNTDGSFSILFGYYNRNLKQNLDIAIGPDNRIEPGGPDQGQPTHFLPRRQWGVFTVTVPANFGEGRIVWTLTANGKTIAIPASLDERWELSPFRDATGNTPPYLGFRGEGPFVQGPRGQMSSMTAAVSKPVPLALWVADDANVVPGATTPKTPPVSIIWSKFRGPGAAVFASEKPVVEKLEFEAPANTVFHGKSTTTVTFSEPGEYVLRAQVNDWSGEGGRGFQCCWSNAEVRVTVTK